MFLSGFKVTHKFLTCSVLILSKPQFSPFFGFSEGKQRHKGVDDHIWYYKVESVVEAMIVEQIHCLLHSEAKSKLVSFGSEASVSSTVIGPVLQQRRSSNSR